MNCPVCGKEMEKGYIPTGLDPGLFWLPEDAKRPFFIDNDILAKRNGVALAVPRLHRKEAKVDAFLCRSCSKCLLSYDENASLFV